MTSNEKFLKIKAFAFDVDGVLTDGGILADLNGELYRVFDSKDGKNWVEKKRHFCYNVIKYAQGANWSLSGCLRRSRSTFSRGEGAEGSKATEAEVECGRKVFDIRGFTDFLKDIPCQKSKHWSMSNHPSRIPHPS